MLVSDDVVRKKVKDDKHWKVDRFSSVPDVTG